MRARVNFLVGKFDGFRIPKSSSRDPRDAYRCRLQRESEEFQSGRRWTQLACIFRLERVQLSRAALASIPRRAALRESEFLRHRLEAACPLFCPSVMEHYEIR